MNRVQASACPRRSVVAACRALPASVSLILMLVALACASAAPQARAGSFDWRSRGILFRVVADVPVDAGPGSAAATSTAIGVDAIPSPPPMTTATQVQPEPSFLFATIHYGSTGQQGLFLAGLRERLEASRMLVNELSGAEQWRPEYEAYRSLGQGQRLSTLLGTQAFAQLQAQLPAYTADTLDGLKPWVAMSMLEMPDEPEHDGIDLQLEDWAREGGLRVLHLENLPEQLAALDCVPAAEYAAVLGQRLRAGWSFEEEAARTLGHYRQRDLPAWYDEIERMPGLEGAAIAVEQRARHCLIEARNARWLPVLERLLREGDCFVAVGAIHLTGDHGLLAQLSRRGFTVTVEPW